MLQAKTDVYGRFTGTELKRSTKTYSKAGNDTLNTLLVFVSHESGAYCASLT